MQEADGDRLEAGIAEGLRGAAYRGFVQRRDDLALRIEPLRNLDAVHARHQYGRLGHAVVEQVRAGLAADFEDVAKPLRGDQADLRPLALDDQVGGHGGAVADVRDLAGGDAVLAEQLGNPAVDGLRRVMRGGGNLVEMHGSCGFVDHGEVGERPADIDTDSVHGWSWLVLGESRGEPGFARCRVRAAPRAPMQDGAYRRPGDQVIPA
ncbi:hypothetical protein D3C81_1169680 [compost metagenome]